MARLRDKVAVITGGASGIGAAAAALFAREGAKVVVADVQADLGQAVAAAAEGIFVRLDVSRDEDWAAAMAQVAERFGRLDVVFNNAGVICGQSIEEVDPVAWARVLGINLTGVMLGCRHGIALMRDNPGGPAGSLINTASTAGRAGLPRDAAYSASKGAVLALTRSVAVHCAKSGYAIRCNAVLPGATDTPILLPALSVMPELAGVFAAMSPTGRMGSPEEVAAVAAFLASDEASYVTGAEFLVDGGMLAAHPGG